MSQQLCSMNTTSETVVNRHKYFSLFASDQRDFLLSPTGAQVFSLHFLMHKYENIYNCLTKRCLFIYC
ncbi:hypothetical protein Hanom_Chr13g01182761 [Helianthus anomalus]